MKKYLLTFIAIFTISFSTQAETIDFQALEHVDAATTNHVSPYIEDGFQITASSLNTFGTLETRYSGSTAMFENLNNGVTTLSKVGGGAFDLNSIDLAELIGNVVANITFTRDGGHTQTFTLDGVSFGAETFIFDSGFLGSTTVTWAMVSPYHQFDNIVLNASTTTAVPTLSEWAIILLSLLLIGVGLHRSRRVKNF